MEARIASSIVVVKVVVDVLKARFPILTGRWTQVVVFILATAGGIYSAGVTDFNQMIIAIATIFAGAVTADQLIKRTP